MPENNRPDQRALVCIVILTGDDYEQAVDAANDAGGSTQAVVEHLSQWDHGTENDQAAAVLGTISLAQLRSWPHQVHEVTSGGLEFWLLIDHGLRMYALYREPLDASSWSSGSEPADLAEGAPAPDDSKDT